MELMLGDTWNPDNGARGAGVTYDFSTHATVIAPTGSGKGVGIEIPNLLAGFRDFSCLNPDPSGQNAAVTAAARRRMGHEVVPFNPYNLQTDRYPDLADAGYNLLTALPRPDDPRFMLEVLALGDSSIVDAKDTENASHFANGARGLMSWLSGFVRLHDGARAGFATVRDILTGDLQGAARAAVACGHRGLASLASKYTGELNRELSGIVSTAEVQTRWLLDDYMRASLAKPGFDFARMQQRRVTCFLILPAGSALDTHAVWFRLLLTSALNIFYRSGAAGRVPVLLLMSEFAQLGKVPPIRAAFGQARKYNLRCLPILQNWGQLVDIYGQQGAWAFVGNSDCVAGFNPGHDLETARFFSELCGSRLTISKSASPDLQTGIRENVSESHEPVWSVDRIRQIPEFHGLVWRKNRPVQPVYFEPYMDNAAQRRVARADPYHAGGGAGRASSDDRVHGGGGVAVSFIIVLLLALALLGVM
jgi:type IV secretion system protein VirD4